MQLRNLILPIAVLISLLLYYPAFEYGIASDYLGWLDKYDNGSWSDIWHSFGYHGLHQFFHLVNYTIFKLTKASPFGLYIVFSVTHGLASYCVYRFLRAISEYLDWDKGNLIAFFTAVYFLVSPYQIEVVTWKACYHYMMIVILFCLSGINYISFLKTSSRRSLILHFLFFVLALFTLELSYVFPGIMAVIGLTIALSGHHQIVIKKIFLVIGGHIAILLLFFLLSKMSLGDYVGHYGAEQHLNLSPLLILSTFSNYLLKYMGFCHFLPYDVKMAAYNWSASWGWIPLGLGYIGAILLAYKYLRQSKHAVYFLIGLPSIFIAFLPVLNLFFVNLHWYEIDRYGYFASIFVYFILITGVFAVIPRWKYLVSSIIALGFIFLSKELVIEVGRTAGIMKEIAANFDYCQSEDPVFIASIPENNHGIYMFRDYEDHGKAFKRFKYWNISRQKCDADLYVFSNYNQGQDEGVHTDVQYLPDGRLRVWNIMNGSWLWHNALGITSYENETYRLTEEEGHFYVEFKGEAKRPPILYLDGVHWKVVE